MHRSEELEGLGGTGLQTQDSLGITRARLAKQKLNESLTLLNQIRDMEVGPAAPAAVLKVIQPLSPKAGPA